MRGEGVWLGGFLAAATCVQLGVGAPFLLPPAPVLLPMSDVSRTPLCGEGYTYFRDFMKCDASLGDYCFEYDKASCTGQ